LADRAESALRQQAGIDEDEIAVLEEIAIPTPAERPKREQREYSDRDRSDRPRGDNFSRGDRSDSRSNSREARAPRSGESRGYSDDRKPYRGDSSGESRGYPAGPRGGQVRGHGSDSTRRFDGRGDSGQTSSRGPIKPTGKGPKRER
jgi:hypothetical protein